MSLELARPTTGVRLRGRYRVGPRIASGGMGTVYRARDLRLDRDVAVKVLHTHHADDAELLDRFRAEARHAARVRHPNVVAVIDQDDVDGLPFIVMELVDGPSLRDELRLGPLSSTRVRELLPPICAGLTAVHDAGLVHRDVKPENLLIDERGTVRVADFGIARALHSTRCTPTGVLLGSVDYIAPEVVLGHDATPASDQYALGVVGFEALTGQTPLPAGERLAVALRHAREDVPAPGSVRAGVDPALDALVVRATARDPGARFPSLDALIAAADRTPTAGQRRPRTRPLPGPRTVTRTVDVPARRADGAPPPSTRPGHRAPPPSSTPAGRARPPSHGSASPGDRPPRQDVPVRRRRSALAVVALVLALFEVGAVASPVLGFVALRRIERARGRLRGAVTASVAVLAGLARLGAALVAAL